MDIAPILATLKDLIGFRTTGDRPEERTACADYIVSFFKDTRFTVEKVVSNGVENVLVTRGTKTPKVFLYGHYDVVDGYDEQFEPYEKDGRLYGRGTMDMKGAVAVIMHIMREIEHTDLDVGLVLVGDEEVAGNNGLEYVLTQGYRSKVMIMADGGNEVHRLIAREKGLMLLKLQAKGVSAHGSRLWLGENAIVRLYKTIDAIRALFVPIEEIPEDRWVRTFNIGTIAGGMAMNQVPDFAEAAGDIRLTEKDDPKELEAQIRACLQPGVELQLDHISGGVDVDTNHELVRPYLDAIRAYGREPIVEDTYGRSDASVLTPYNIPVIQGQPDGGNYHAKDEWVSFEGIQAYYAVVRDYLGRVR